MKTLHIKQPRRLLRIGLLTLAVLIVLLVLLELALRLPVVTNHLPAPGRDFGYRRIENQYAGLERLYREAGQIDCIFMGNSVVQYAFDTRIFEQAYAAQSGEDITCYNFGMAAAQAESEAAMARVFMDQFQPRLLIWGLIPRDLEPPTGDTPEVHLLEALPQTDWIRYLHGESSLNGWLLHHSASFRYLSALSDILRETPTPYWGNVESRIVHGYQPAVYSLVDSPAWMPIVPESDYTGYTESPERVAQVRQITLMDGHPTRILLLEMPIHTNYVNYSFGSIDGYRRTFHESLRYQTPDTQALLWATDTLTFHDTDFVDNFHLWASGSARFSEWLGYQVGEAHNQGLFGDVVPEGLRFNPPLEVPLPQLAVDLPSDNALPGLILDPQQMPPDNPSPAQQLGLMLEWAIAMDEQPLTEQDRRHLHDFLRVLNQAQRADELPQDLSAWRVDMEASHLDGIGHVLVPSAWVGGLASAQQAAFNDPTQYEIVNRWWHPVQEQNYTLYRVLD